MNPIENKSKSKGRKKIEIKRIKKEENQQVCFSKHRQGLFKKDNDLCTLCGTEVAIVVFSLAGKPYSFGHPSIEHVLCHFLNVVPTLSVTFSVATSCSEPMNEELIYLRENLEAEIKRRGALEKALKAPWLVPKPFWWENDLRSIGIKELRKYEDILL